MQGAAGGDGGLFISHSLRDVPIPSGTSPAPPASPPPGCLPGHFLTCSPGIASAALPSGRAAAPPAGSGHRGKPSLPSRTASSTAHWRQVVWTLSRRQCPQGPQGTDVRESRKPSFKRDFKDRLVDGFLSRGVPAEVSPVVLSPLDADDGCRGPVSLALLAGPRRRSSAQLAFQTPSEVPRARAVPPPQPHLLSSRSS